MDRPLHDVLAAARATLAEWIEEGVDGWEPAIDGLEPAVDGLEPAVDGLEPAVDVAATEAVGSVETVRPGLDAVRAELGECTRCRLHEGRSKIVFGDGHPDADLMFVGEGPGEQEDRRGIPFCGRAGDLLTSMIEKGLGIPRSSVYICNIVKCRPPNNRTPLADEVSTCRPFLDGQIEAVAPKVIVTLGKPATSTLLGRDVAITKIRGTWQSYRGIPVMPTFHPAFLLRQYTRENRQKVWDDLKAALGRAGGDPSP